ncbi:MAG: glycosyltransferase 87 family protein, partial [Actinomycetota bacterium]|nr:glycosyltransferase 87 family protein [Actinomycetota bacterium]
PLRVTLAIATVVFGLGVLQKSPCVVTSWSDDASPKAFSHLCYTDIPYLYVSRGLAEGIFPYTPTGDLPPEKQPATSQEADDLTVEYPVLTGLWMGAAGWLTRQLGESPDVSRIPHSEVGQVAGVQHDTGVFWCVNAVGFFLVLMLALLALVKSQRRRPWDAMFVAASPMIALAGFINWDMLAVGCVAGALWAWSTKRPVWAGIFLGLGVATKLFPLFLLGPLFVLCLRQRRLDSWTKMAAAALTAWLVVDLPVYLWSPTEFLWFWHFNAQRGPDFGSVWLLFSMAGHSANAHQINAVTFVVFGGACLLIGLLGLLAPRKPRLVQLMFLVAASFLIINKVYSPQYVLWLLPLAALARPRWRDLIIWQACEIFYFFAVWMHIANFFVSPGTCHMSRFFVSSSGCDWVYSIAIVVRILGEVFLMVLVVRDILQPWHDPVRADGLSDDPLGGVLDEGIDAEPFADDNLNPLSRSDKPDLMVSGH